MSGWSLTLAAATWMTSLVCVYASADFSIPVEHWGRRKLTLQCWSLYSAGMHQPRVLPGTIYSGNRHYSAL